MRGKSFLGPPAGWLTYTWLGQVLDSMGFTDDEWDLSMWENAAVRAPPGTAARPGRTRGCLEPLQTRGWCGEERGAVEVLTTVGDAVGGRVGRRAARVGDAPLEVARREKAARHARR